MILATAIVTFAVTAASFVVWTERRVKNATREANERATRVHRLLRKAESKARKAEAAKKERTVSSNIIIDAWANRAVSSWSAVIAWKLYAEELERLLEKRKLSE
jgi:hypothetical protein